jgi:hypothetical protein
MQVLLQGFTHRNVNCQSGIMTAIAIAFAIDFSMAGGGYFVFGLPVTQPYLHSIFTFCEVSLSTARGSVQYSEKPDFFVGPCIRFGESRSRNRVSVPTF